MQDEIDAIIESMKAAYFPPEVSSLTYNFRYNLPEAKSKYKAVDRFIDVHATLILESGNIDIKFPMLPATVIFEIYDHFAEVIVEILQIARTEFDMMLAIGTTNKILNNK